MAAIILFAPALAGLLFLFMALSPKPKSPSHPRTEAGGRPRPRIRPALLRSLVAELLIEMGFRIEPDAAHGSPDDGSQRLVGVHRGPWSETRHVVFIEAAPPNDRVEPTTVLELAEHVKTELGAVGLLVTPYEVDRSAMAGVEARIEIIDGAKLRELVAREIPHRLGVLDQYGIGVPAVASGRLPLPPQRMAPSAQT